MLADQSQPFNPEESWQISRLNPSPGIYNTSSHNPWDYLEFID
jgi:hypothetical protein